MGNSGHQNISNALNDLKRSLKKNYYYNLTNTMTL